MWAPTVTRRFGLMRWCAGAGERLRTPPWSFDRDPDKPFASLREVQHEAARLDVALEVVPDGRSFLIRLQAPQGCVFSDGAHTFYYGSPPGHPEKESWGELHGHVLGQLADDLLTVEDWRATFDREVYESSGGKVATLAELYSAAEGLGCRLRLVAYGWEGYAIRLSAPEGFEVSGRRHSDYGSTGTVRPAASQYALIIMLMENHLKPARAGRARSAGVGDLDGAKGAAPLRSSNVRNQPLIAPRPNSPPPLSVPETRRPSEAREAYENLKSNAQRIHPDIRDRRIYSLVWKRDGREYVSTVGLPDGFLNEEVWAVFETERYFLVLTANHGVAFGEPYTVERPARTRVVDFLA